MGRVDGCEGCGAPGAVWGVCVWKHFRVALSLFPSSPSGCDIAMLVWGCGVLLYLLHALFPSLLLSSSRQAPPPRMPRLSTSRRSSASRPSTRKGVSPPVAAASVGFSIMALFREGGP